MNLWEHNLKIERKDEILMGKKEKEFKEKYQINKGISEEKQRISGEHEVPSEYLKRVLNKKNEKKDKTKKPLKPVDPIFLEDKGTNITHQGISPER